MKHKFGGVWTRKKLIVLEQYLHAYSTALKRQPFQIHYVDAFAGTGFHSTVVEGGQQMLIPEEDFKGSVTTALEIEPGFDQYHFNDLDPNHFSELRKIREKFSDKHIELYQQDANEFIPEYCQRLGNARSVLFLDPYSTQLDWATLSYVAATGKVDLWMLFPISVILRMTPRDSDCVRPEWKSTLDRLLGTSDWESSLYKEDTSTLTPDLFDSLSNEQNEFRLNTKELENWVTSRLKEIFPYVAKPLMLKNNGRPLFLFYFAVSNENETAWGLASRIVTSIQQNFTGG